MTEEYSWLGSPKHYDARKLFELSQQFHALLGNPQNAHKTVRVAGTSGKGTVCYLIDAILRAHNRPSGLIVSPHVYDIRERIQINGQLAPEKEYIIAVNRVLQFAHEFSRTTQYPTYIQFLMGLSLYMAARERIEYLVVETGLGGRLDATNTITRDDTYVVLTQIGLDHTAQLGTTYEQIAAEKAAIIPPNGVITALSQKAGVNQAFLNQATKKHATLHWVEASGDYATDDLLLAINATRHIAQRDGWQFDENVAVFATKRVYIPGRFEKRAYKNRSVILDGAHNPQKLAAFASRLKREGFSPVTIVLSLGEHKDYARSIESLKHMCRRLIICEYFMGKEIMPRHAQRAELIAQTALEQGFRDVEIIQSPLHALDRAATFPEMIVVTGSFYLLGELDRVF